MNKKGQLSITNLFFYMILVFVATICTVIIDSFINSIISTYNITGITLLIMQNITPIIWIGLIATFFIYLSPISGRIQQY